MQFIKCWCNVQRYLLSKSYSFQKIKIFLNLSTKVWNHHPKSKFEIYYLEFQICIWNSKYMLRILNSLFGIPNTLFRIPNTIRNTYFGILKSIFRTLNNYLEFQILFFISSNSHWGDIFSGTSSAKGWSFTPL